MTGYFRNNIARLQGYVPGYQPVGEEYLKLNTNENPYPPAPGVRTTLRKADPFLLRRYPDPVLNRLRDRIADTLGFARDDILVGNGSDEILTIVTRSFVGEGDRVAFPEPSYSLYPILVRIQGGEPVGVALAEDFSLPEEFIDIPAALKFLAFPNSPTGTVYPLDTVERLLNSSPGIVLVDEAYADFAEVNCLGLLSRHPNLIILRTFSKSYGLAGLRVGFALASPELIAGMMKVKDSYNLNQLSAGAAEAAMADQAYFQAVLKKIVRERERFRDSLDRLGIASYPSSTNFVLARFDSAEQARTTFEQLREKRILVRYFDLPRLRECLRITIGTPEAMDQLVQALEEIRGDQTR